MAKHRPREPREPRGKKDGDHGDHGELRVLWGLVRLGGDKSGAGRFDLIWGLIRLNWGGGGRISLRVLWGLLRISLPLGLQAQRARARSVGGSSGLASDPAGASSDAPSEAERGTSPPLDESAAQRLEAVRRACILAGVAIGLGILTDWKIMGLVLAVAAGLLLSSFAEQLLPLLLRPELREAQRQDEARRVNAGSHAKELQDLSASIAHEIRNPITAAKSLVQQMGEDPQANENIEYAKVALGELERVERSVSHLLRFAREERPDARRFALARVVAEAVASLRDRTQSGGVAVRSELDSDGFMIGDPEQLRRVVLNLVGNAVDALTENGTPNPTVTIELGENLAGTEVWLRVGDNGPGIAHDELDQIFSPFHTSRDEGTGLGLPITRKLVEAHGGSIEVKSSPGSGAEFLVTLPKAALEA